MHTVTRNNNNNKKGIHLVNFINGEVAISLKNAKILCGYSETSSNKIILEKVEASNIITFGGFTKKGNYIEDKYLTLDGFRDLASSLTQKDKKQNAILAITMINEAIYKIMSENNLPEIVPVEQKPKQMSNNEMFLRIKEMVGNYSENKEKWVKLYDELDKYLPESIRKSHQRHKRDTGEQITLLGYIHAHTALMPELYKIAVENFGAE